ncbi:MAG: flagellar hook-length control protein FliK [Nitrospira sp.]|nr:flagellar hook-length control protein FliK [Nitrospira sp.]
MGRSQAESDETDVPMSSDESAPTTTASPASGAARDEQAGDRSAEPSRHDSDAVTASPLPDVTTQSVLLALIAQPIAETEGTAMMQTLSDEQTNNPVESVMPSVMEDGTSLPVTAADSSTFPQIEKKEMTGKPADPTTAIQAGTGLLAADDTNMLQSASTDQDATLRSPVQPTPEDLRHLQQEKSTFPLTRDERPQASSNSEVQTEFMVQPNDQRSQVRDDPNAVKALAAEQIQQPEDNRPVVLERPIPAQQAPEPKEDVVSRRLAVPSTGWQEPTQQDDERGMEWSGRDHRERQAADQAMAQSATPEVSAPATPSHSSLMTNGVDHRAFSSAPSAKLPADTQPATPTLPVQPTDWMPGPSTNQTKSMMLELSQADLGRVNIRVAVNQDTVHTHFVSERNELGQYLMNGQDRLQSALNASGLDLGRFQVDIDRQSAGRSFQEPTSQGQSHGHTPQGEGRNSGPGREEAARDTAPRRGMLNLVA